MPVSAFKMGAVASFDPQKAVRVFQTSGTTRRQRGSHYFESLRFYDAVIPSLFKRFVLPDRDRIRIVNLIPSVEKNPDSSLSYMAGFLCYAFDSSKGFDGSFKNPPAYEPLLTELRRCENAQEPVLMFATSFALAGFLDFLNQKEVFFDLPVGSRLVETGGYKGRWKEVSRTELVKAVETHLKIPAAWVINEYGMTELTSHFYDTSLLSDPPRASSVKRGGFWTRVRVIDPVTGRDAPEGQKGLLRIYDLANQGSVAVVQTEDEGRLSGEGFELLGRQPGADLRGCSLTFEAMERLGKT